MTTSELLVMLGRAWARLLLYPGGLAAFGVIWLLGLFRTRAPSRVYAIERQSPGRAHGSQLLVLSSIAAPWLGLALLPLPLTTILPRQLDVIVVLALLEWPQMLAIAQELRARDAATRAAGARRLAATLNGSPALILATLLLAQASGSLEIMALTRAPGGLVSASAGVLHWIGAVAWALALPPLLGIGPFATREGDRETGRPGDTETGRPGAQGVSVVLGTLRAAVEQFLSLDALALGLRLRALGLVALAALPWAGEPTAGTALPRMLGAMCLIAALLWGYHRLTSGRSARHWARGYLVFDAALLLALLWGAYQALQSRWA